MPEIRGQKSRAELAEVAEREFKLPGLGACFLPREFAVFTGPLGAVEMVNAAERPQIVLSLLVAGRPVALSGDYVRADGIYRYCARNERQLAPDNGTRTADRHQRIIELTAARRMRLHHLLFPARGDSLIGIDRAPDTAGLQQWLQEPTGDGLFLMPVRRLQRILTDMRRAREGLPVAALDSPITILPHVYVPADTSVPAMLVEFAPIIAGRKVLDMGTGTGVLALLAARLGAAEVVATDSNPKAVENARINADRLGMSAVVRVRGPAHLFDDLRNEVFDVIVFNAPWADGIPKSLYDTAIYDPDHRVIDGFMKSAPAHLAPGGVILLQYSDVSDSRDVSSIEHLTTILAGNGLFVASTRAIRRRRRLTGSDETVRIFEIRRKTGETGG